MQLPNSNLQNFLRQILTLMAIIAAFIINVVSNIYPLNGMNIGTISNTIFQDVLIVPANYAFIIWGLIYVGLFSLGIYQVLPNQKEDQDLQNTAYFLVIASVCQSIWVYFFLARYFDLSVVAMLGILISLMMIYYRLGIGKKAVNRSKKLCLHYPISIYLSWISVATIVNIACTLHFYKWTGWGINSQLWTVIMLIIATIICGIIVIKCEDIPYSSVTVWALIAIAVKHWDKALIRNSALILAMMIFSLITFVTMKPRN
ncbi:tryptophan-rich sensory protein [Anabaena sp. FACHB-1237]|uniref:tryptophan-rich sensory protein n=1 Tax=Anabaena sp. FACHB-1237 TaxID=2692769 RepID=UPI0016817C30|nr:tryptophan-rich sensory protein [Anabaena sp. FACHB-1237]MBD2136841.1 tryptophan-rich sensory protein [Anabaena sp. FACHB-1237]